MCARDCVPALPAPRCSNLGRQRGVQNPAGGPPRTAAYRLWYHPAARQCGRFHAMANIKQQRKRVRTAARERIENLRYRSTIRTLTRRLETAVQDGDEAQVTNEHRRLQQWIDRAAARGAIHRNLAARKKAQAARLVTPKS